MKNVKQYLKKQDQQLKKNSKVPMNNGYCPKVDLNEELDELDAAYFQSLIGILRWIDELGHVDIVTEVSMLSSCLVLPREGNLHQLYHIFAYLEKKKNTILR